LVSLKNDPNCQKSDNLYHFLKLIGKEVNYKIRDRGLWVGS
jgi:hypothetical protein